MNHRRRALRDNLSWHTTVINWNRLHYIPEPWPEEDWEATAICGVQTIFCLPGVFSRMGLERCAHCCRRLGIPVGNGTPPNEKGWAEFMAKVTA